MNGELKLVLGDDTVKYCQVVNGVRETNNCGKVGCQGKNMKDEVIKFERQSRTNEV